MNSKRKCKLCKNSVRDYIVVNMSAFCSFESAVKYANENKSKGAAIIKKSQKKKDTARKKELMTRSKWLDKLKVVVNRYVLHVRDKDKPCYTCGTTSQSIKHDAGHRYHAGRGGADRRRFVLENIHKQCSMQCNQHGSGKPKEYDEALAKEYGVEFVEYLACEANYPTLKELFPTWQDIETEIARYRKLLKDAGI